MNPTTPATATAVLTQTSVWLIVALGLLFYFFNKIKKQYKIEKAKEPKLTVLTYIGRFLATDVEDYLLSIGIYVWLLTGHSIFGFEVNTSSEVYCFATGYMIPVTAVNIVLQLLNQIPAVNTGDRSQKRITEEIKS